MTDKQKAIKALQKLQTVEHKKPYHGHAHTVKSIIGTCEHRLIEARTVVHTLGSVEATLSDPEEKGFALVAAGLEGHDAALKDILIIALDCRLGSAWNWTVGTLAIAYERAWGAAGYPVRETHSQVRSSVEAILDHMHLDPWMHDVTLHPADITSGDDPFWESVEQYSGTFGADDTSDALRNGLYYDTEARRWHVDPHCEYEGVRDEDMASEGYECVADAWSAYEHALHVDEPVQTKADWDLEQGDRKYDERVEDGLGGRI